MECFSVNFPSVLNSELSFNTGESMQLSFLTFRSVGEEEKRVPVLAFHQRITAKTNAVDKAKNCTFGTDNH